MNAGQSEHGLGDRLNDGLIKKADGLSAGHPLELSEKHFKTNKEVAEMKMASMWGSNVALKIQAEKRAVAQVGHLPCITQRSNVLADVLGNRDETIGFEDVYGKPENFEGMTGIPHTVIEKTIGDH